MAMTDRKINQYSSNDNAIINGAEKVYHDVNAGGECRVPWCTYSSDVDGSEHLNIDRVLLEPGQYNLFKKLQRLEQDQIRMQGILATEFRDEMHEDADWDKRSTHDLTAMVLRLLKLKRDGANDKLRVLGSERDKWLRGNEESATLWQYITETWPIRLKALERQGHKNGVSLIIGLMEQLRADLMSYSEDRASEVLDEPARNTSEGMMVNNAFLSDDHMTPEARRNVTLNDLHTMLQGLVLSGADVAVRDLHEYVARHVRAVHALIHTSLQLEGYSDECCYGCEEHGSKNEDPKYDRPHGKRERR